MSYHFIGIGGIGMSAIARILASQGHQVQGSDQAGSSLLDTLVKEGIKVQIGHSREAIEDAKTVVISTGIKEDNVELIDAKKRKLPILHRSEMLDFIMKGKKRLLVSGTHGKTTTTALLATTLITAGLDPSFVVGGLIRSLNTNGRGGRGDYFVAEADESDGSFLRSTSHAAILTNVSNDHLDYWQTPEKLDEAFCKYMVQTEKLFWCFDDVRLKSLKPKGISYGFNEGADFQIAKFRETSNGIVFDLNEYKDIELALSGKHNALNASAVFALALHLKVPEHLIRKAFKEFSGTARRLELKGEAHRVSVYDDYGHHPREITATLSALRGKVKERRIIAVFQPHRYTRVRDLFDEFTTCFSDADEVFLTDIYGAGEAPIEGVTSAALYTRMREKLGAKLHFFPRNYLEAGVAANLKPFDVVITIGAGDITKTGLPILQQYAARAPKLKAALLFGGVSSEHAVSLMSMQNILKGFDPALYEVKPFGVTRDGHFISGFDMGRKESEAKLPAAVLEEIASCDVCMPVFHGPFGEDGMIAAILDALQIPYVGCDYKSGAICMQKAWSKYAAIIHNVRTAPFIEIDSMFYRKDENGSIEKIEATFSYPVWVKPVHLGSSIGVNRAANQEELIEAIEKALSYDDFILVEKEIKGRQIEFAVLGNDWVQVPPPGEIVSSGKFVGYDEKYGEKAFEIRTPAKITSLEEKTGIELAEKIYRALRCSGLARVDFFLDEEGCYWFNEINPFPGCTETSAFPQIWKAAGKSMAQVIDDLVMLAFHRSRKAKRAAQYGATYRSS